MEFLRDWWPFLGYAGIMAYGWMCVWIEQNFFSYE